MKYTNLAIAAAIVGLTACNNAADKVQTDAEKATTEIVSTEAVAGMKFTEESFSFGDIAEGTVAEHEFEFTNTGESPLVITSAKGSCGCTVPEYPNTPIAPGATGVIKVSFDSNGRPGQNDKTVTIDANTVPRTTVLKITSNVIPKAQ